MRYILFHLQFYLFLYVKFNIIHFIYLFIYRECVYYIKWISVWIWSGRVEMVCTPLVLFVMIKWNYPFFSTFLLFFSFPSFFVLWNGFYFLSLHVNVVRIVALVIWYCNVLILLVVKKNAFSKKNVLFKIKT